LLALTHGSTWFGMSQTLGLAYLEITEFASFFKPFSLVSITLRGVKEFDPMSAHQAGGHLYEKTCP
jgi:hypothetical protein